MYIMINILVLGRNEVIMAKLYFRYSAMNAGKTTMLLQVAHNYEERDMNVVILKAAIDVKGGDTVVTRTGLSRKVDFLIEENFSILSLREYLKKENIACVLIDEAQFLSPKHIEDLWYITKLDNIPVICYGLRSDFKTNGFPGSIRLFELADELEELITICRCGKRAKFNARVVDGKFTTEGDQVVIDEVGETSYESVCGMCYITKVKN